MTPAQLDEFAINMRNMIKEQVERTGRLKLGAVMIATRNILTGEEFGEPKVMPLVPIGEITDVEQLKMFSDVATDAIAKTKALAIVVFCGAKNDRNEPMLWVSYERVRADKARDWYAVLSGNQLSEFSETLSELAFFDPPN